MKTGNSWKERDSFSNRNGMYIPETLKLAKPSQVRQFNSVWSDL